MMTVETALCDCDRCVPAPADDRPRNDKARVPDVVVGRDTGRAGDDEGSMASCGQHGEHRRQVCSAVDRRGAATDDDLMAALEAAAVAAIRNQAPALTGGSGVLRSVNLELEISNAGAVVDSTCWVERRGVHRRGR